MSSTICSTKRNRITALLLSVLLLLSALFNIYHEYDGGNNLKTVNDSAGGNPVEVDGRILALLLFCRELERLTDGRMDVTMGRVLALWYQARREGVDNPERVARPNAGALEETARHTGFSLLELDEGAST